MNHGGESKVQQELVKQDPCLPHKRILNQSNRIMPAISMYFIWLTEVDLFYSCNSYNSRRVHTAVLRIILVSCLKWQLDIYTENTEYNTEGLVCTTCTWRCQHYILQSSSRIIFQTTVLYKLKNTRFSSHKIHNYYRSWPQCHQLSARLSYVEPQWWVEGATGAGSCWSQALNLLYNILQLKF